MKFKKNKIDEFYFIFETVNNQISSFHGCNGMRLIYDKSDPSTIFTYSEWENNEALEKYRNSDLFLSIWPKVKLLFSEKPMAWSCGTKYNGFK